MNLIAITLQPTSGLNPLRNRRVTETTTRLVFSAKVSVDANPATVPPLVGLLENYFSDMTNQPWTWLANAESEVPFFGASTF